MHHPYRRLRELGHQRVSASLERALVLKCQLEEAVPVELVSVPEPLLAEAPLAVMAHLVSLAENWQGNLCGVAPVGVRGVEAAGDTLRVALVLVAPDRLAAWYEAALYFPLELFVAVGEDYDPEGSGLHLALQAGARIFLTDEPRLALDGAQAALFGEAAEAHAVPDEDGALLSREEALERYAAEGVLLLEDEPLHAALVLRALAEA